MPLRFYLEPYRKGMTAEPALPSNDSPARRAIEAFAEKLSRDPRHRLKSGNARRVVRAYLYWIAGDRESFFAVVGHCRTREANNCLKRGRAIFHAWTRAAPWLLKEFQRNLTSPGKVM